MPERFTESDQDDAELCSTALAKLESDPAAKNILEWLQNSIEDGGFCTALLAHWHLLGGRTLAEAVIAGEYKEIEATLEGFDSGVFV